MSVCLLEAPGIHQIKSVVIAEAERLVSVAQPRVCLFCIIYHAVQIQVFSSSLFVLIEF